MSDNRLTPIRVLQDGASTQTRELFANGENPPWVSVYTYGEWIVTGVVLNRDEGIVWRAFNPLSGVGSIHSGLSELLQRLDALDEEGDTTP